MERKLILGGSITAVVIIVLASFTNVVGYQSVESQLEDVSPLFTLRTQKATNQEITNPICTYIGENEESNLLFLPKVSTITQIIELVNRIKSMDDITFSRLIRKIFQMKNQNEQLRNLDETTIITSLNQIRKQDIDYTQYQDNNLDKNSFPQRMIGDFTSSPCWFPGRFILLFIEYILMMTTFFLMWIYITIAYPPDCNPPTSLTLCCL